MPLSSEGGPHPTWERPTGALQAMEEAMGSCPARGAPAAADPRVRGASLALGAEALEFCAPPSPRSATTQGRGAAVTVMSLYYHVLPWGGVPCKPGGRRGGLLEKRVCMGRVHDGGRVIVEGSVCMPARVSCLVLLVLLCRWTEPGTTADMVVEGECVRARKCSPGSRAATASGARPSSGCCGPPLQVPTPPSSAAGTLDPGSARLAPEHADPTIPVKTHSAPSLTALAEAREQGPGCAEAVGCEQGPWWGTGPPWRAPKGPAAAGRAGARRRGRAGGGYWVSWMRTEDAEGAPSRAPALAGVLGGAGGGPGARAGGQRASGVPGSKSSR